jgi:hypothetical protein
LGNIPGEIYEKQKNELKIYEGISEAIEFSSQDKKRIVAF